MASYLTPGVFIEEKKSAVQPIEGVSTSVAAFIGVAQKGPVNKATLVTSVSEFVRLFGGPIPIITGPGGQEHYLYYAVRHFFVEGGTKCYVVRVTGYGDVNVPASIQAFASAREIGALALDGVTAVPNALRVEALTPGTWGDSLQAQIEQASRLSVLLEEAIVAGAQTQITLKANQDVQVGSVLFLVEQVTGAIESVNSGAATVVFRPGFTAETASFTVAIPVGALVFSPDMKFVSQTVSGPHNVTTAIPSAAITLGTVTNVSGGSLKAGDIVNFNTGSTFMVVVKKITEKLMPSGDLAMVVTFDSATLPVFAKPRTKVYARDFDILVKDGPDVVEAHTHLSLINTNRRDYVNDRLSPSSGASNLITAFEKSGTAGILMVTTPFINLTGGNDGLASVPAFGDDDIIGSPVSGSGLFALDNLKDISLLVVPNSSKPVSVAAIGYCEGRKNLFFIMDVPRNSDVATAGTYVQGFNTSYGAAYYPWIVDDDPLTGKPVTLPPSGALAGTYAHTDVSRGVHKAPAGLDNGFLNAASGIERLVSQAENDVLYQKRVNVIRKFPEGILVWGARTLSAEPAWRYVNVRRLFIFLEQSIERGLQWVVFEPNDFSLWKSIKRNVSTFLRVQWEESKLVGPTEDKAFFVRCDDTTNTPATVAVGQVIAEIGVAPSKPAEFVVFRFKQIVAKSK
ncbi:MAG: phage tail sheath C-terminal domain-containing protein [Pseudomonadota bacterium]